jgi:Mg-chelatase subunit ChlD
LQLQQQRKETTMRRNIEKICAVLIVFMLVIGTVVPVMAGGTQTTPSSATTTEASDGGASTEPETSKPEAEPAQNSTMTKSENSSAAVSDTKSTAADSQTTKEQAQTNDAASSTAAGATKTFTKNGDYTVTASYGKDANLPENVELKVSEITNSAQVNNYTQKASSALANNNISSARFFDISFISNGAEIEPNAAAKVDIQIKLSNSLKVNDGQSVQAVHFPENTAAQTPEILSVGTETDKDGDVQTVKFTQNSFSVTGVVVTDDKLNGSGWPSEDGSYVVLVSNNGSYYALKNDGSLSTATVSTEGYVGFDQNFRDKSDFADYLWTSNQSEQTLSNNSGGSTVYVYPDSSGVISNTKNEIQFVHDDSNWYLKGEKYLGAKDTDAVSADEANRSGIIFVQLSENTATMRMAAAQTNSSNAPQAVKTLTDNGNGTYNLSLSVTGKSSSSTTTNKADVIVVLDLSGSMNWNEEYSGERLRAAKAAVNSLATTLLGQNKTGDSDPLVKISLVTFSNNALTRIEQSTDLGNFISTVNGLQADGGTNWEDALKTANGISTRSDANAYIVFVSDGNPTYRDTRDAEPSYYEWDTRHKYPIYSSEDSEHYDGIYGSGNSDKNSKNFKWASEQAKEIANDGKTLYSIGVFGDASNMKQLAKEAGQEGNYYSADDETALKSAFSNIASQITNKIGYRDVTFTDGLTSMTARTLVDGSAAGFTYEVSDAQGNPVTLTDNKNGTYSYTNSANEIKSFKGAIYNKGTVTWSMDVDDKTPFELDDGYKYTASFTVWPKQDAYDLVADLNNGTKTYADLDENQKAQIISSNNGTYNLKTNTDGTNVTYKPVTTITNSNGTVETNVGEQEKADVKNPDGIPLTGMPITLTKSWNDNNSTNRPDTITLNVIRDKGKDSAVTKSVVLSSSNNWSATIYLAPGLIVNSETKNAGHTYDIEEPDSDARYELDTKTYNPMLIDSSNDIYDGSEKAEKNKITSLIATNNLRGSVSLEKKIQNADGNDITNIESDETEIVNPAIADEQFTYSLKLESPKKYTEDVYKCSFTPQSGGSTSGTLKSMTNIVSGYSLNEENEKTIVNATITLKPGEKFTLDSLPIGTIYTFVENPKDGYTVGKIDDSNNDKAVISVNNATVSATADANQNDEVVYTNKLTNAYSINLVKTDGSDHNLAGAEFTLKKGSGVDLAEAYTMDGTPVNQLVTGTTAILIGDLPSGTYTLTETKAPSGYVKLSSPVTFTVNRGKGENGVTSKDTTVTFDESTNTYQIKVGNAKLYTLPETGGTGIFWNVIIGTLISMFFAYAAISTGRRERRKK